MEVTAATAPRIISATNTASVKPSQAGVVMGNARTTSHAATARRTAVRVAEMESVSQAKRKTVDPVQRIAPASCVEKSVSQETACLSPVWGLNAVPTGVGVLAEFVHTLTPAHPVPVCTRSLVATACVETARTAPPVRKIAAPVRWNCPSSWRLPLVSSGWAVPDCPPLGTRTARWRTMVAIVMEQALVK